MHIEIKASEGKSYTLNDTLPSTLINEIYIFFEIKNNIVYINTTFNMIKEESKRTNKDIESIMKAANEEIKIFREKRKKDFKNTYINSFSGGNYSININFIKNEISILELENIFIKSKLI